MLFCGEDDSIMQINQELCHSRFCSPTGRRSELALAEISIANTSLVKVCNRSFFYSYRHVYIYKCKRIVRAHATIQFSFHFLSFSSKATFWILAWLIIVCTRYYILHRCIFDSIKGIKLSFFFTLIGLYGS